MKLPGLRSAFLAFTLAAVMGITGSGFAQTGPHGVDLNWTASADAGVSYNVYRSQTSGSNYAKINTALVSGLTFSDNSVSVGQTYFYVVRSVLNGVESVNSNEVQARILPSPPVLQVPAVR